MAIGENELRIIAQLSFQRRLQSVAQPQPDDPFGRQTASISQVDQTVSHASLSNRELRRIMKKAKSQSSSPDKKPSYINHPRAGGR